MAMRFLPASLDGLLVELDDLPQTLALLGSLQQEPIDGVTDIVPAARTVLVGFEPARIDASSLAKRISERSLSGHADKPTRHVEIPVRYDGEDLAEVAALVGITPHEVARRHAAADYRVAFTGFAPGFAYLSGGDPSLDVPRRRSPRTRIPAGSVALAGKFSGVYPKASPGGWQLIGTTDAAMWDLSRAVPALLQPGDAVRFVDATASERDIPSDGFAGAAAPRRALPCAGPSVPRSAAEEALHETARSTATPDSDSDTPDLISAAPAIFADTISGREHADAARQAGPCSMHQVAGGADATAASSIEIVAPGLQTLVQDLGRPGSTGQGVSASGALDRRAMRAANRLVGNDTGAVVLESVGGGLRLRSHGDTVIAITGAEGSLTLACAAGTRWEVPRFEAVALTDADTLLLGPPRAGLRSYVAVRGGFDVTPVLGSCATDTLAGIGPAPLVAGALLAVHVTPRGRIVATAGEPADDLPTPGREVVLDVVPGPRTDWFASDAIEQLCGQPWTVTPQSNRIGLRLAGERPLTRAVEGELPSEGTMVGALQVPPNGQPVLFLADHPLTGGYPIVACLAPWHRDRAGQIPVDTRIRFRAIRAFSEWRPTTVTEPVLQSR